MNDFNPRDTFLKTIRYWWVVAVMMILGACFGELFHHLQPPIYEASAKILVSIDFTRTGKLTELEQDQAIFMVIGHVNAKPVFDEVAARAESADIDINSARLVEVTSNERKSNTWQLKVRHPDPEIAAILANYWAQAAIQKIDSLYVHALMAETYQKQLDALTECLLLNLSTDPVTAACSTQSPAALQENIQLISATVQDEKNASMGIIPGMIYSLGDPADIPEKPANFQRGNLLLAGMLIGFLAGILLTETRLVEKITGATRRA
ncbi:MAG TPA: hypothetical protein PLS77_06225 [Anaerolineaceae bacterium]|nr:hypothetical protein [Anaerolineaceae bacterium]HQF45426.1 hypothetical protein [Anaerolineaceae bacterium]HQH35291.1 hypothetical protein [Anaerolineaceae bacterium]HQJ03238.1 hypothetical protein [Anaerolineaceae bacterium]